MRVVMLVNNDWKHDSRVIREAEALGANGYAVTVICRRMTDRPVREEQNSVVYECVPYRQGPWGPSHLVAWLRLHLQVLLLETGGVTRRGRRTSGCRAIADLLLHAIGGLLGMLFVPLLALRRIGLVLLERLGRLVAITQGIRPWLRARIEYVIQPYHYLNDFAESTTATIGAYRPDVVHAHDLVTLSAGALAARRLGCRLVYDAHELETDTNYHSLNRWTKYWIARYERALAQRADAVITVCDSIADWLANAYGITRPRVVLNVPKVIGTDDAAGADDVRQRLGLPPEVPLVLYVGSVTVDRGLDVCTRALAHLPGVHFVTVGPRYDVTEREILETARAIGVLDRVHLVDPVPSSSVVSFIRTADCSVIPIQNVCLSYYFCFPNKLLESVLAGLPVAAADLLELRRFLEMYKVGVLMDEKDPVAIAAAIKRILTNRDAYRPSAPTLLEIRERYGWLAQESQLLGLYDAWSTVDNVEGHARSRSGAEARGLAGSGLRASE